MGRKAVGLVKMKPCECVKDSDGQCNPCKEKMHEFIKSFSETMYRMMKEMQQISGSLNGMCQPCGKQYLDIATAGIIASTPHACSEALMMALKQMRGVAQSLGITAMPLTEKAATEFSKAKGWSNPN